MEHARASVTCDISHWLMSTLNCVLPWNRKLMSVTRDTSQWGMVISHSRSPTHASTAALSSALVVTSGTQTATSVSARSVHDVTPLSTYPASHSGTQDVPLTRVSVQVPTPPSSGRIGRVARVVLARPPAAGEGAVAARKPGMPCGCRIKHIE